MPGQPPRRIGKCDITGKLGEGGMGVVFKGRHADLHLDVAVKMLAAHLADNEVMIDRFMREARLAARIDHSGVVRVLDCGREESTPYMVMEFVRGQSLEDLLKKSRPLEPAWALDLMQSVAEALSCLVFSSCADCRLRADAICAAFVR